MVEDQRGDRRLRVHHEAFGETESHLLGLQQVEQDALVGEIKAALSGALDRSDANKLSDLVGVDAAAVTAEPWPV